MSPLVSFLFLSFLQGVVPCNFYCNLLVYIHYTAQHAALPHPLYSIHTTRSRLIWQNSISITYTFYRVNAEMHTSTHAHRRISHLAQVVLLHYFVQMLLAKTMHSAHMRHTRPIGRKRMWHTAHACICTLQLLGIVTCVNNLCSLETAGRDNYR